MAGTGRRRLLQGAAAIGMAGLLGRTSSLASPASAPALAAGPIPGLDALALSAAIHARELSAVEVMQAYLGQIEHHNPRVNAIVSLRKASDLMAEARACDAELAKGHSRGWMHGMPYAAKDLVDVQGLPTVSGSPLMRGTVATKDAVFIGRIRAAGALFIGKTNVPEFGYGSQSYNPVFGVTRNAWDPTRTAGGSSGGAAAALALRMLPVADGSDMMGSLRIPAAFCGVVGFRPSPGLVPTDRRGQGWNMIPTLGPMGRTVADTCLLLSAQAAFEASDPLSRPIDGDVFRDPQPVDPGSLRVAYTEDWGTCPIDPRIAKTFRARIRALKKMFRRCD